VDRFIVGTGRCGSTLLSRMLAECPRVTSLFEFFNGLDMTRRFGADAMSGPAFAEFISQPHPFVTMVLSRGYEVPEIVYPFAPESRFTRGEGLPWILVSLLSRLSSRPDPLYDETLAFARALPTRALPAHYRALFDWLVWRTGRSLWIERSGSSIDYVASLKQCFPAARFVHIHRDGPETALSIREHHAFRLAVTLSTAHLRGDVHSLSELGELDTASAPDVEDAISRQLRIRPAAPHFGEFWSRQLERGMPMLNALPPEERLDLRFEDLVCSPREALQRICDFFEIGDEGGQWIERAAGMVHGMPAARVPELPESEREALQAACATGNRLLGR
jgi:putative sulfotransferase